MRLQKPTQITLTSLVVLMMTGCASSDSAQQQSVLAIEGSFLKSQPASKVENQRSDIEVSGEVKHQVTPIHSMAVLKSGSPLLTQMPKFASSEPLKIALNEMELPQLAHYILGEVLKLDYVIASDVERMREKVALNLNSDLTPIQLFDITRQVLAQHSTDIYTKDNIVYVSKRTSQNATRAVGIGSRPEDLPPSGDDIIQLIPYTFNSARSIISIINKLTNAKATPDNVNRLLLVEGTRSDVERVIQIVGMMDVPHAKGRDIRMISLVYLSPDELMRQVDELLAAEGISSKDDVAMVVLQRLNAVVVYASNATLGDRVSMWAKRLDVATGGEKERFYVYRPKFAKASELLTSIQGLLSGQTAAPGAAAEAASSASAGRAAASSGIKINADEAQNALVVNATPSKYQELLNLLEQLDRLPGQVALQVVVAEIDLGKNNQAGIDWTYNESGHGGTTGNRQGAEQAILNLTSGSSTLALNAIRGDWRVALNMIASKTDVRVLSRPYLVVRDGESASISSGVQVPIVTETTSSDVNPDVSRTSVQYRSTGINVSVTPTINADGLVSLQITQETSNVPGGSGTTLTPSITSRSISTSVFAADGQTVVLGGLIQDSETLNDNGVPGLRDIPLLGKLFRSQGKESSRSELIILITPRIIRETSELDEFGRKLADMFSFPVNM